MAKDKVRATDIARMKVERIPIAMLTAYDFPFARIFDAAGVDVLLVGDSLGMVIQGADHTLAVTLDEVIYHTKMVARARRRALLVADLPFLTYQVSVEQALVSSGRLIKEGGAEAVKLEGGVTMAETIRRIVDIDIPVLGHIGLTPQSIHRMGGHRVQGRRPGKTAGCRERLLEDAEQSSMRAPLRWCSKEFRPSWRARLLSGPRSRRLGSARASTAMAKCW